MRCVAVVNLTTANTAEAQRSQLKSGQFNVKMIVVPGRVATLKPNETRIEAQAIDEMRLDKGAPRAAVALQPIQRRARTQAIEHEIVPREDLEPVLVPTQG